MTFQIFDREGWSPNSFKEWSQQENKIDIITYRKGKYEPWPLDCFMEVKSKVRNKKVQYLLGERSIKIKKNFWLREVRRLCANEHQTSIITTRQDLAKEEIARRMFFRWNQENYFKYMREEYNLDHLVSRDFEQGNCQRLVPNPEKKTKKKELARIKSKLKKMKEEYGDRAIKGEEDGSNAKIGFKLENYELKLQIKQMEENLNKTANIIKQIPDKIEIKEVLNKDKIVKLDQEKKRLTDTVKMTCYQMETKLIDIVSKTFARTIHEGRTFMKNAFQQSADIIPYNDKNILLIKFHTMSTNSENIALQKLCKALNEKECYYPGTNLKLVYQAPLAHSNF